MEETKNEEATKSPKHTHRPAISELFGNKLQKKGSPTRNIQLARSRSPGEKKEIIMVSKHSGDDQEESSDGFDIL